MNWWCVIRSWFIIVICSTVSLISSYAQAGNKSLSLAFVILSQPAAYDNQLASSLKRSLLQQAINNTDLKIDVFISHLDFGDVVGAWTISPLFSSLQNRLNSSSNEEWNWIFFCEIFTQIDLSLLGHFLLAFNASERHFIGRALFDNSPTIIHHFYGYDQVSNREAPFLYPDFAGGLAISSALFQQLHRTSSNHQRATDFSIDPKHEFARMVFETADGITLTDTHRFCLLHNEANDCITRYIEPTYENCVLNDTSNTVKAVTNEDVLFAVKTYHANHKKRIVIVKRTWAKMAKFVEYFSDMTDQYVPTIDLGVNNTERGHCEKTLSILKYFLGNDEMSGVQWLAVVDDDTLIGVPRLYRLLSCYSPLKEMIIGERYGYGFSTNGKYGYEYPTGGAGMVFSRPAVQRLIGGCRCPSLDSPDDMIIGMCARRLQIPIIHSAAFHQARSIDYSPVYIQRISPISFHKFEEIDPYEDYMQLLHERGTIPANRPSSHSEL